MDRHGTYAIVYTHSWPWWAMVMGTLHWVWCPIGSLDRVLPFCERIPGFQAHHTIKKRERGAHFRPNLIEFVGPKWWTLSFCSILDLCKLLSLVPPSQYIRCNDRTPWSSTCWRKRAVMKSCSGWLRPVKASKVGLTQLRKWRHLRVLAGLGLPKTVSLFFIYSSWISI